MNLKSNSNIITNSLTSETKTTNNEKNIKENVNNDDKQSGVGLKKVGTTPFSAENRLIQ